MSERDLQTALRVLIVEDSQEDAELVLRELRRGGYRPEWQRVDSADGLVAALGTAQWDVITCDYVLPHFGALATLEHIKRLGIDVPVIIVSGQVGEDVAVAAMKAGAHDYVSKHRLARLVPAIARELREAEARRNRRRIEESLRLSEAKYRDLEEAYAAVFAHSLQGLAIFQDGRLVLANPALVELTGYTVEEQQAWTPEQGAARLVHPDDLPRIADLTRQWLARDVVGQRVEFRLVRKDGSERRVLTGNTNFLYRGKPATLVAWSDITERWRAEEALRQLNAELEARVAERTAQLEGTARELEAFSYSVSHDLRAPLRAIDGFTQAVLEDAADVLPGSSVEHLRRVRRATQRMGGLIDQLLALARAMRAEVRNDPVDLSGLAREVAAELARGEPDREVAFSIADGLTTRGDADLLRTVLVNLLGNAWKFTRRQPHAEVEFGRAGNGGGPFYVRDNGAGFEIEYADRLFSAFQRLHTPEEFEGSGIGLATVRRIIERHGGRVWAESAPDAGATFYFTLRR